MSYSPETLWEAYGDGQAAFDRGEPFASNPYTDSVPLTEQWQEGWMERERYSWRSSYWETETNG